MPATIPYYSTINRRINNLNIKIKDAIDDSNKFFKDEYIIIAIDNTEIKVTNRRCHGYEINGMWKIRTIIWKFDSSSRYQEQKEHSFCNDESNQWLACPW